MNGRWFHTDLMGYSVQFSPFQEHQVAVATAQHFGIIGQGAVLVLDTQRGVPVKIAEFRTKDGAFDCCWSEIVPNHLLSSCGDGSIKLWDCNLPGSGPVMEFREHKAEVYAIDWNLVGKRFFVSGAWDNALKLWDPQRGISLRTFLGHTGCIYSARWSPYRDEIFASSSGDCSIRIWDSNVPNPVQTFRGHDFEVLSLDWNKYNSNILVSGSVDRSIRVWDLRSTARPVVELLGHEFAVRRVKCSPHSETTVLSASYDMSVGLWDYSRPPPASLVEKYDHHSEFVVGIDFNLFREGQFASCAWDEHVCIWNYGEKPMLSGAPAPMI